MTILETRRLVLRRLVPSDLEDLVAFYRDPEVVRYIPDAPRTVEEIREELEWFLEGHPRNPALGLWATIHRETGHFIGRCGLLPWSLDGQDEVEVAFALSRAYWGRGLATEAAHGIVRYATEQLGLSRLICVIEPGNHGSARVASRIGMTWEKDGRDEHGSFMVYAMNSPGSREQFRGERDRRGKQEEEPST